MAYVIKEWSLTNRQRQQETKRTTHREASQNSNLTKDKSRVAYLLNDDLRWVVDEEPGGGVDVLAYAVVRSARVLIGGALVHGA